MPVRNGEILFGFIFGVTSLLTLFPPPFIPFSILISLLYNEFLFQSFLENTLGGGEGNAEILGGEGEVTVRKRAWQVGQYLVELVEVPHEDGLSSGVGQCGSQQQTVFKDCGYNLHGGVEIGIGAGILFGVAVIVPFAENGKDGCQAHGKQPVTEYNAAGIFASLYQSGFEPQ